MSRSNAIRWITLTSFCLLLTAFILYRAGRFDKYLYNEPKIVITKDTIANPDTPLRKTVSIEGFYMDTTELMHSSKSGYIVYPSNEDWEAADSLAVEELDSATRQLYLSSGSKSAPIFLPKEKQDSALRVMMARRRVFDSLYRKSKKQ